MSHSFAKAGNNSQLFVFIITCQQDQSLDSVNTEFFP